MESTQALLTLAFNIICIGYTTLSIANLVCGLYEEWVKLNSTELALDSYEIEATDKSPQLPLEPQNYEVISMDTAELLNTYRWDLAHIELLSYVNAQEIAPESNNKLGALTIRELKSKAKERHIPRYGNMRKSDLIQALAQ
ncbi:Rho termination factor N-terminal domain-containing protein [Gloeocapsopsis sp. IPPAS B-1203]|uniref:Rho termination factor N-terminal domain-containing protein n=1 Tax=Gloeocapsopsis sp. IPPAS B-1203 TaxID=2049454 RepID=UPI000C1812B7|nr:Rho termination factor N-terminal domain-containing protein [Gloeocapsopsis sp. IPPAS B-1203]PIG93709.1 hypothetical protein CSQ79_08750 [Gloeocapsopsis sp. IPPAS B-1203]